MKKIFLWMRNKRNHDFTKTHDSAGISICDNFDEAVGRCTREGLEENALDSQWVPATITVKEITDRYVLEVAADMYVNMVAKEEAGAPVESEVINPVYDMDPDVFHDGGRMV